MHSLDSFRVSCRCLSKKNSDSNSTLSVRGLVPGILCWGYCLPFIGFVLFLRDQMTNYKISKSLQAWYVHLYAV